MSKVSVGIGTIVGLILTTASAAATAWATAEGANAHIKPGLLAVLTVVAGSLMALGRMYQAGQAPPAETPVRDDFAPGTALADLAPADGVDSADVPRATA